MLGGAREVLKEIWNLIGEIEHNLNMFDRETEHRKELQTKIENLRGSFYHKMDEFQRRLPSESTSGSDRSKNNKMPAREEAEQLLKDYFDGKIEKRASPIPNYSGCHAVKILEAKGRHDRLRNHFICVRRGGAFLLHVLTQLENDGSCVAFDPTSRELNVETFPAGEWTPLPIVIPEKPTKRWEYKPDPTKKMLTAKKVDGKWTTEFYMAYLRQGPSDRPNETVRGYTVECDGETFVVPEMYVVQPPDEWL